MILNTKSNGFLLAFKKYDFLQLKRNKIPKNGKKYRFLLAPCFFILIFDIFYCFLSLVNISLVKSTKPSENS